MLDTEPDPADTGGVGNSVIGKEFTLFGKNLFCYFTKTVEMCGYW